LKTYKIRRGSDEDSEDVLFSVQQAVPNIFWGTWNFTLHSKASGTLTFAQAEQQGVLRHDFVVTLNQTVASQLTQAQRDEASGLFSLILGTRLLQLDKNNDSCSSFLTFGIPILVLFCCFACVSIAIKMKNKV